MKQCRDRFVRSRSFWEFHLRMEIYKIMYSFYSLINKFDLMTNLEEKEYHLP